MKPYLLIYILGIVLVFSCKTTSPGIEDGYTYFEVGFDTQNADWRDTAFIVRTKNADLVQRANAQLNLPEPERQIVFGKLVPGNGGYNKNATHSFKWHFKEDEWDLVDIVAEIYDGKPYTDVDQNYAYWMDTMTRFGAWSSYIKKQLPGKP